MTEMVQEPWRWAQWDERFFAGEVDMEGLSPDEMVEYIHQVEQERHELADALEALLNIADSSIDYNAVERARDLLARVRPSA